MRRYFCGEALELDGDMGAHLLLFGDAGFIRGSKSIVLLRVAPQAILSKVVFDKKRTWRQEIIRTNDERPPASHSPALISREHDSIASLLFKFYVELPNKTFPNKTQTRVCGDKRRSRVDAPRESTDDFGLCRGRVGRLFRER